MSKIKMYIEDTAEAIVSEDQNKLSALMVGLNADDIAALIIEAYKLTEWLKVEK